jgi:AcrR family transcriptional regulator
VDPRSVPRQAGTTHAGGRETRRLLMRSAERLFAQHGIDSVSLRAISTDAGLRMAGAVGYHFGDKDGLIRAIVADRSQRHDRRAGELLERLREHDRLDDLRALTEAAIRPAIEELGRTGYYYRFLAQLRGHPQTVAELFATISFGPSTSRIMELQEQVVGRVLPDHVVQRRRRLVTHLVHAALADLETGGQGGVDEVLVCDLIDCIVTLYATPTTVR